MAGHRTTVLSGLVPVKRRGPERNNCAVVRPGGDPRNLCMSSEDHRNLQPLLVPETARDMIEINSEDSMTGSRGSPVRWLGYVIPAMPVAEFAHPAPRSHVAAADRFDGTL